MPLAKDFIAILRCVESRAPLVLDGDFLVSTDPKTRRRYKVEDDIPNLCLQDSEVMAEGAWTEVLRRHGMLPKSGG